MTKLADINFPFAAAGDTIQISGIMLQDATTEIEYHFYLPDSNLIGIWGIKALHPTPEEWEKWLHNSDDPTFPIYADESRKVVKAVIRKMTRQVDQNIAWKVYKRAGYACEYCGATDRPLTYDHFLAQAYGGLTTIENGRASCRPCNKAKGHKTIAEWQAFCKKKGLHDGTHLH